MAGEKVLIVEDDFLVGRELEGQLKRAGYKVVGIAETAKDAIKLANQKHPLVVLMDLQLLEDKRPEALATGELSGPRTARRIQRATGSQIIYMTAYPEITPELLSEAYEVRDCQFLLKPIRDDLLLAFVRFAVTRVKGKSHVFLSYSHKDRDYAKELLTHLQPLEEIGVRVFVDTQIELGQKWKGDIQRALNTAKAAICLTSSYFINSRFIKNVELPALFAAAHDKRRIRIIPIFARYVDESVLDRHGLLEYQAVNTPQDTIDDWTEARRHKECWGPLCNTLLAHLT